MQLAGLLLYRMEFVSLCPCWFLENKTNLVFQKTARTQGHKLSTVEKQAGQLYWKFQYTGVLVGVLAGGPARTPSKESGLETCHASAEGPARRERRRDTPGGSWREPASRGEAFRTLSQNDVKRST